MLGVKWINQRIYKIKEWIIRIKYKLRLKNYQNLIKLWVIPTSKRNSKKWEINIT